MEVFVDIPFCRARIFGKGRRKIWKGSWKVFLKKGARITGTALGLPSHYALHVLRPYHGEDGSIFVKRSGATRDADLLSPDGLSQLLNRPGKGVTMLAGTRSFMVCQPFVTQKITQTETVWDNWR